MRFAKKIYQRLYDHGADAANVGQSATGFCIIGGGQRQITHRCR